MEDLFYDFEEFFGVVLCIVKILYDVREVIVWIVDGSCFYEFKVRYVMIIVCGFVYIYGYLVGILVNNGVLFLESALKATYFIEMCCYWKILLFFF